MKCAVIIPVGPGHEKLALAAVASVRKAWRVARGELSDLAIVTVPDPEGLLGRSRARNQGLDENPADWHFLLDADDAMEPLAFSRLNTKSPATFGAVCLNDRVYRHNIWPCTRETILERGAKGTLSMGCFVRGDLGLRFDESLDVGEDFDFYLRLPGFVKRKEPLVKIGYDQPSAGGPRGYFTTDWLGTCNSIIAQHQP